MAEDTNDPKTPSQQRDTHVALFGIRGRNGYDTPLMVQDGQCVEALNVDWYRSALGRKRGGADAVTTTGGTAFGSGIRALGRFVPGDDESAAELWGLDGAFLVKRMAGGSAFADVTMVDTPTSTAGVSFTSLNGKFYFAYKAAGVNRLHVYDPVSGKVRRCGLAGSGVPSVANTGAGAYAATLRYYRTAYLKQIGGVTVLRSELSTAVSFTPSGGGTAARVTKPAAINEDETHWVIYGSQDDSTYNLITTPIAVGTTTFDDTVAPSLYNGDTPPLSGSYLPPPSAKYLVSDDARVVMMGAHETAAGSSHVPSSRRVWWTSALGSSDVGDDERVSNSSFIKSYADIEESGTGLSKPINGSFLAFSYRSQWKFVGTGVATAPYVRFRVAGGAGCVSHQTIVTANDASGSPATYWVSEQGPMRNGSFGQQFIGQDVIDLWERVNLDSTTPFHAVVHTDLHQVWFWISIDGANVPNCKIVFDTFLGRVTAAEVGFSTVRFGWSRHSGESANAYCSCMFSTTTGASMSRKLKPYIGYGGSSAIWKLDTTSTTDAGTPFQGYIEGKPSANWGLGRLGGINNEPVLIGEAAPGVTIKLTLIKDEGAESLDSFSDLSPVSLGQLETVVFNQFEGASLTQASTVRIRVGDAVASEQTWNLYAVILPTTNEGER